MQGGVGDFTRALAVALTEAGHDVFVLTDPRATPVPEARIQVTNAITRWNWRSLARIRKWAHDRRLDVVNLQYETAAFGMTAAIHFVPRAVQPLPTVTTFHDLLVPYLFPKAGWLRMEMLRTLARHSAGVIVTNRGDEGQLTGSIPNLTCIPIGSNIRVNPPPDFERDSWRARSGIPLGTFLIGYFGFFNASKGIDRLLDGTAQAMAAGLDARVLLIGGGVGASDPANARYQEQIKAQIEALHLESRVIETGYVSDTEVSAYLLACDVIALPFTDGASFRRGSLMAALAHGCAIITTEPTVALPELAEAVQLIPVSAPDSLAAALITLAAKPDRRAELGTRARTLAAQFSWESIAAATVALYQARLG